MSSLRWVSELACGEIAAACGVTRLADITGLDCIGVPVFQAVRPRSRALCVHQGKGLTMSGAMTGALMEAIESHRAETFRAPLRTSAYNDLPRDERALDPDDFAADDRAGPDPAEPLTWVEARRIRDETALWVPFEVVSLDFTERGHSRLDRSSNGLGAGYSRDQALSKALLEVIERDAHRAWREQPLHRRSLDQIDLESAPYAWFQNLRPRLAAAGCHLAVYAQPTPANLPVVLAELIEANAGASARRAVFGLACDVPPEAALLGAVLEAIQSRAAMIAGVRDDIALASVHAPRSDIGWGFPLPPSLPARDWIQEMQVFEPGASAAPDGLVDRLTRAGFPDAAVIDLSPPGGVVFVVKAVVPGLGGLDRSRRAPRAVS